MDPIATASLARASALKSSNAAKDTEIKELREKVVVLRAALKEALA